MKHMIFLTSLFFAEIVCMEPNNPKKTAADKAALYIKLGSSLQKDNKHSDEKYHKNVMEALSVLGILVAINQSESLQASKDVVAACMENRPHDQTHVTNPASLFYLTPLGLTNDDGLVNPDYIPYIRATHNHYKPKMEKLTELTQKKEKSDEE